MWLIAFKNFSSGYKRPRENLLGLFHEFYKKIGCKIVRPILIDCFFSACKVLTLMLPNHQTCTKFFEERSYWPLKNSLASWICLILFPQINLSIEVIWHFCHGLIIFEAPNYKQQTLRFFKNSQRLLNVCHWQPNGVSFKSEGFLFGFREVIPSFKLFCQFGFLVDTYGQVVEVTVSLIVI